jgi:hypothetical protein
MAGTRARTQTGNTSAAGDGPDLTRREAAEYIASLLEGLKSVANSGQMPFLAYLLNIALEEANNEKTARD